MVHVVPDEHGDAFDRTVVLYVPEDPDDNGIMSIVIHETPTNPTTGLLATRKCAFRWM